MDCWSGQHRDPACVREAQAATTVLSDQFVILVDPDPGGRLIHARRRHCAITSDPPQHAGGALFAHCRAAATLGEKHWRLERLLQARARLQLTRLVAEQV